MVLYPQLHPRSALNVSLLSPDLEHHYWEPLSPQKGVGGSLSPVLYPQVLDPGPFTGPARGKRKRNTNKSKLLVQQSSSQGIGDSSQLSILNTILSPPDSMEITEQDSTQNLRWSTVLLTLWSQTSSLEDCKRIHSCSLELPSLLWGVDNFGGHFSAYHHGLTLPKA